MNTDSEPALALNTMVADCSASMTGDKVFTLSNYRDRIVVLYFYPKNGTPGCTTQGLNFRDSYARFQAANTDVFGVSRDNMASHEAFKAKLGLPFDLISDPDETLCRRFSVVKSRNMYGKPVRAIERSTFVIDGAGKLVKEWRGLDVSGHVEDVLATVQMLS